MEPQQHAPAAVYIVVRVEDVFCIHVELYNHQDVSARRRRIVAKHDIAEHVTHMTTHYDVVKLEET